MAVYFGQYVSHEHASLALILKMNKLLKINKMKFLDRDPCLRRRPTLDGCLKPRLRYYDVIPGDLRSHAVPQPEYLSQWIQELKVHSLIIRTGGGGRLKCVWSILVVIVCIWFPPTLVSTGATII